MNVKQVLSNFARGNSPFAKVKRKKIPLPVPPEGEIHLNLGCGDKILPGFVNVDIAPSRKGVKPDVCSDLRKLEFPDDHADLILAVHVIEHFYYWEAKDLLNEWIRVLKPGGTLVIEVPNLLHAARQLLKEPVEGARPDKGGQQTMWVFYGDPEWKDPLMCHRWGYTPQSLCALLGELGLVDVAQKPAQFKKREPRDMRVEGKKPLPN